MAIYRCTISGHAGDQVVQTALHVTSSATATDFDEPLILATRVAGAWVGAVIPHLSSAYQGDTVSVTDLEDGTNQAFVNMTATGGVTGEALPTFVTASVRWVTGRAGWAARGRMSFGPLAESQTVGNELDEGVGATIEGGVEAAIGTIAGSSRQFNPVVLSTIVNGAPRPVPLTATILSAAVSPRVGTQLRRKR